MYLLYNFSMYNYLRTANLRCESRCKVNIVREGGEKNLSRGDNSLENANFRS